MRETKLWTWHLAAGAVILILLGLHMIVMHLNLLFGAWALNPSGGAAVEWANVLARSRMMAMVVIYTLLLGAALYHGLYGLRTILFELGPAKPIQRLINVVFLIGGTGLFVIGTWATIVAKLV